MEGTSYIVCNCYPSSIQISYFLLFILYYLVFTLSVSNNLHMKMQSKERAVVSEGNAK